jgi:hypothetical protein
MTIAEFIAIASEHGLWYAVAVWGAFSAIFIWRSNATTRNKTETEQSRMLLTLVSALNRSMEESSKREERSTQQWQQILLTIKESGARQEGMMIALTDNTKALRGFTGSMDEFGHQMDEFGTRVQHIPQIQTDLHDLVKTNASFQAGFTGALDERFTPVLSLMMNFGTQLNTLTTQGLTIISLLKLLKKGSNDDEDLLPQGD